MANGIVNGRQRPYPLGAEDSRASQQQLLSRSQAILNALINLLPSNYTATVVGPNYTVYLKAMATELARITVILEDLGTDVSFDEVRSEFLWQVVGYLVFLNQQIPELEFDDESFRNFLTTVIGIYFKGSTPAAIAEGIALFADEKFTVREMFKDGQQPQSPWGIADQFAFGVDFELEARFPKDPFALDRNIRLLLEIIRPAHTLYRSRFVFGDHAGDVVAGAEDSHRHDLRNYHYDDARKYFGGMAGFQSATGIIRRADLNALEDGDPNKPLNAVKPYSNLLIETGPNRGWYRVASAGDALRVFPAFKAPQEDVIYHVEVDRLGQRREVLVEEDVSFQIS